MADSLVQKASGLKQSCAGQALSSPDVVTKKRKKPKLGADNWPLLRDSCRHYLPADALEKIEDAYLFAADKHIDQRRRSGEPYINHPVEVAIILSHELHMDEDVICSALLHDTVEDTDVSLEQVTERFGPTVAELVDGVTKLTSIEVDSMDAKQALNLRKMFLAMSKDIRVLIIKIADRLHNMRTLAALPPERRVFKAKETMDVYAPLADRLGISSIKWELEDLAFFYIDPEDYQRIARMVQDSREQRELDTNAAIKTLTDALNRAGMSIYQITGRPKHLWSIFQKMRNRDVEFSDIYDLIALRVITQTLGDCYSALGAVHSLWHPLPGRFKDYIATPKPNLYQSIHTTVVGPTGRPIEIQIRTLDMHEQAEFGIAAHWLYKKSGNSEGVMDREDKSINSQINWIRKSLDWATEADMGDPHEFLSALRIDLFEDEIFVFTPKGEVVSLRRGATPLDFAYAVHSEVGNHCVGAKVNGSVVPLNSELKSGNRVEILTNKNAKPSQDWLNIVVTPSARSKIKRYFALANKSSDAEAGRSELAREMRRRGYGISTPRSSKVIASVAEGLRFKTVEDMFAGIATGKVNLKTVAQKAQAALEEGTPAALAAAMRQVAAENKHRMSLDENTPMIAPRHLRRRQRRSRHHGNQGIVVAGDPDLAAHLAHCCNPVAGDDILGFITRGGGVSVHRSNCPNAKNLMQNPERIIEVGWDSSGGAELQVEIVVEAADRMGLLSDISCALGETGANILSSTTQVSNTGVAYFRFLVALSDVSLLDPLLATVGRVPSVFEARRLKPGEGSAQMRRRI